MSIYKVIKYPNHEEVGKELPGTYFLMYEPEVEERAMIIGVYRMDTSFITSPILSIFKTAHGYDIGTMNSLYQLIKTEKVD